MTALGRALLLVLLAPAALAQVQDDFADGDFTADPPWQGDADRFTVALFDVTEAALPPASWPRSWRGGSVLCLREPSCPVFRLFC